MLQVGRDCVTANQGGERREDAAPATVNMGDIEFVR
jgi:hypothetical protein